MARTMPRRRRIKAPEELHKIEGWLFAILRFAITPEQTNRAFVMAVARQMDRPGSSFRGTQFGFFVRTSIEFCDAIAAADHPEKLASLRHQIKRIDNPRLRRAFEGVLEIDWPETPPSAPRGRDRQHLFKGLAPSGRRRDQETSPAPRFANAGLWFGGRSTFSGARHGVKLEAADRKRG